VKPPAKKSNPIGQSRREVLREAIAREEARLDTLFLTLPVSWKGTLIHRAQPVWLFAPACRP